MEGPFGGQEEGLASIRSLPFALTGTASFPLSLRSHFLIALNTYT